MKRTLAIVLALAFSPAVQAASPADVAAAAHLIHQTAKLVEKYAAAGIVLEAPEPRADSEGKYVSPYLSTGERTAWADKALQASVGSAASASSAESASASRPDTNSAI